MKYLIVKAWLGFGDRLESLKMAVKYAIKYNLQIYVDWTDAIWSHGDESFYKYFDLVNMPTLKSIDDIPADATVYPEYWVGKLKEPFTFDLLNKRTEYNLDLGILNKEYPYDVIVFSSIGNRELYPDSEFFGKVFRVIHPKILKEVKERQIKYKLSSTVGIHIRGTDRVKNQYKREMSIQYLALHSITFGSLSGKQMVCVSDDKQSFEIWKRFHPQTILFSNESLKQSSTKGNHNTPAEELKTSKDDMNIEMLIDFFTLASCERVLSTYRDSRFYRESTRLHPYINMICNG